MTMRQVLASCFCLLLVLSMAGGALAEAPDTVYVAQIEGTIDDGLLNYLERSYQEAEEAGSDLVLLEIDTPGGLVESAVNIFELIAGSPVPTAAFVKGEAISAGSLIALTAKPLYLAPSATMGAAEPHIGTEVADEKTQSYWESKLRNAAELHGRDKQIAAAFADQGIAIPGVVAEGELLTLTAREAVELGMADGIAANRQEVLEKLGAAGAQIIEANLTSSEKMVRWITSPFVSPVLLMVGIAGLVIEAFTMGFGVFGAVGLIALVLYFSGHILAGLAAWWVVLLFLVGLILLAVEAFVVPGFGIPGVLGLAAMISGVFLTYPTAEQAIISLVFAILGTIVLVLLSVRVLPTRKLWQRLILNTSLGTAEGYLAPKEELEDLLGKEGVALSILRPAGSAEIDGERVDVVTEGGFIPKGAKIKVVNVESTRVVVRQIDQ